MGGGKGAKSFRQGAKKGFVHKAAGKPGGPKHQFVTVVEQRQKVIKQRVTGKLTDWKGHFGWIQPSQPINHPDAQKHKGKVYMAHEDVEAEISGVGANVSFFVYKDNAGLRAMNVRQAGGPPQKITYVQATQVQKTGQKFLQTQMGKGKKQVKQQLKGDGKRNKGKANKEPKEPKEKKPSGPDLPRERVDNVMLIGEVLEWKKRHGWIKPSEPISHEKASEKHNGKIYVSVQDLEGGLTELEAGKTVQFYLYSDASGLGAEEVTVL